MKIRLPSGTLVDESWLNRIASAWGDDRSDVDWELLARLPFHDRNYILAEFVSWFAAEVST